MKRSGRSRTATATAGPGTLPPPRRPRPTEDIRRYLHAPTAQQPTPCSISRHVRSNQHTSLHDQNGTHTHARRSTPVEIIEIPDSESDHDDDSDNNNNNKTDRPPPDASHPAPPQPVVRLPFATRPVAWPRPVRPRPAPLLTLDAYEAVVRRMAHTMVRGSPSHFHQPHPVESDAEEEALAAIEKGIVRHANHRVADNRQLQEKAQYGRILFPALDTLFGPEHLDLQPSDVFLDLGHGTGLMVLQAAYTRGCESRGIELDNDRFLVSHEFQRMFREDLPTILKQVSPKEQTILPPTHPGKVRLKLGSFTHKEHSHFLTCPDGRTKCLVNNFDGVFADRSQTSRHSMTFTLDQIVAGLFARMTAGSIMITLHPLDLGRTCEQAAQLRAAHKLPVHPNASFYDMEAYILGPQSETVSWSTSSSIPLKVYKYTRMGDSKFVCCNPDCEYNNVEQDATEERRIKGDTRIDAALREDVSVVVPRSCSCGFRGMVSRKRRVTELKACDI